MKNFAHKRDHNVFILGAGFSKEAGLPVMQDFMARIRGKYENPGVHLEGSLLEDYGIVLDYRNSLRSTRDYIDVDLDNIENLFSLISMSCLSREEMGRTEKAIRRVITDLTGRVNFGRSDGLAEFKLATLPQKVSLAFEDVIESSICDGDAGSTVLLDFYDVFCAQLCGVFSAADPVGRSDTVISFNYDLLVESRIKSLGFDIDYGFEGGRSGIKKPVKILKLHGSVNWEESSPGVIEVAPDEALLSVEFDPCIMPPTWQKAPSKAIGAVWSQAVEAISAATRIIIIGYSMPETDSYFKHLLMAGLAKNKGIYKVIIVDKLTESGSVDKKFKSLFSPIVHYGKYHFFGGGFSSFMNDMMIHTPQADLGRFDLTGEFLFTRLRG